jgi:preprotein translocase subunit SecA
MLSFSTLAAKVFGSANDRKIKLYRPTVDEINALEPELEKLSDADLRARTEMFRSSSPKAPSSRSCCSRLPPARSRQAHAGQRHFDVQMIGGMSRTRVIAEMKTGEARPRSPRSPST